jgi:hypothetical protein
MAAPCPPPGYPGAEYFSIIDGVCTKQTSFFGGKALLSQGIGYGVVLGFGALFAVVTSFLVPPPPHLNPIITIASSLHSPLAASVSEISQISSIIALLFTSDQS